MHSQVYINLISFQASSGHPCKFCWEPSGHKRKRAICQDKETIVALTACNIHGIQHIWWSHTCVVAQGSLQLIKDAVNSLLDDEIDMSCDLVLFHKVPATVSRYQRQDIIDLLLIFKHVMYRIRFRENQNRQPTVKLVTISIILETEKLILFKNRQCHIAENLICYVQELRNSINWN